VRIVDFEGPLSGPELKKLGYYDCFPTKAMNVAVKTVDVPVNDKPGAFTRKKVLVCTKDFEPGDLIYKVRVSPIERR